MRSCVARIPAEEPGEYRQCGGQVVLTVNGADVSTESLCLGHYQLRHGAHEIVPPVVIEERVIEERA